MIPVAAFVVGILIFARVLNQGVEDLTTEMSEATLPIVYMVEDGERINELHGYKEEMNEVSVADTVTPVESGGTLSLSVDCYGNDIQSLRYEVKSLDAAQTLQESEMAFLTREEDVATVDLTMPELNAGEEYLLILTVENAGDPCYFYTRLALADDSSISECISFVRFFHEVTMSKTRQSELTVYMETTAGADNNTLQTVTLKNTLSQVCWGNMRGTEVTEPIACVREIGDDYNVIDLSYILSSVDEQDHLETYQVEEYYRIRPGGDRMYLSEYKRTVEEIFSVKEAEEEETAQEELTLGIRSPDVEYVTNETGTSFGFVQQGELWNCNMDSGYLTQVFSFQSPDGTDLRENYNAHDIRIIRTNETGSVDFVVYGYMNRGVHEGRVGISVCHFDSATTTVEEMAFLSSTNSYETLCDELGQTMYLTDSGEFYFSLREQLYCVDLNTQKCTIAISDMTEGNFSASDDGRYLAWTEGELAQATTMHMIDLETGRTEDLTAPDGYVLRPLGFLDSDCVYGLAESGGAGSDEISFPMSRVVVVDFSDPEMSVLKTYDAEEGTYVTGAEVHDGNIYLARIRYADGEYTQAEEDVIYNRAMQDASQISVTEIYSDVEETEVALLLPAAILPESDPTETKGIRSDITEIRLDDEAK